MQKLCIKCNVTKDLEDFRKNKNSSDGHEKHCKECRKEEQRISYHTKGWNDKKRKRVQENRPTQRAYLQKWRDNNRELYNTYNINYRNRDLTRTILRSAKSRAIKKGIEFSIEKEDIIVPEKCPIFNTPFVLEKGRGYSAKNRATIPSLDRIDPSKGYIKGNVWVISSLANTMKNNSSQEELKTFCENFLKIINYGTIFR